MGGSKSSYSKYFERIVWKRSRPFFHVAWICRSVIPASICLRKVSPPANKSKKGVKKFYRCSFGKLAYAHTNHPRFTRDKSGDEARSNPLQRTP